MRARPLRPPVQLLTLIALASSLTGCLPRSTGNDAPAGQYPQLELVAAYPVNCSQPVEPSGLTSFNGELFTVADKINDTIFRVVFEEASVRLAAAIRFAPPAKGSMDWEGITCDAAGTFYLISEEHNRLARVTADGVAEWASPSLKTEGRAAGLFAKSNAGFEGVAWLGPNHWLAAVEREPRGLIEWRKQGDRLSVVARQMEQTPFADALNLLRLPDFSGLDTDGGDIFALFRNAHMVVRLVRTGDGFIEQEAWSYRHIETDPRWAYRSQTYGQAEGIVVDGNDVWLIFDNNLGGRMADPDDGRALLVHARFPSRD